MAINILSIPLISNKPERVFSGICHTVSWDRGQMEAEIIEIREYLKYWKRAGILQTFFETSQFKRDIYLLRPSYNWRTFWILSKFSKFPSYNSYLKAIFSALTSSFLY
jgi:hypothetical protein